MITTEEAERLAERLANDSDAPDGARYQPYTDSAMRNASAALRSIAAERDALRAERNAERNARFKAEAEFSHMQRRIARQRRALAKLYKRRHDRKAERDALRAENASLQYDFAHTEEARDRQHTRADRLQAENARLREALRSVMIGGNHLASILGADHHLPHTVSSLDALEHYGAGDKYDAWCCWKSIMKARDELGEKE
jgi:hypothetical protein